MNTSRRHENRWATGIMDWEPMTGKRKRGRHRRRLRDGIMQEHHGQELQDKETNGVDMRGGVGVLHSTLNGHSLNDDVDDDFIEITARFVMIYSKETWQR